MLTTQVHTLEARFDDLARRAYSNTDNANMFERLLHLALKTQRQSRATVETLAVVKNPPAMFAKPAKVATGLQQVNNDIGSTLPSRARESGSWPTELSEQRRGCEWLDDGTACARGRVDPKVEAVGAVSGTKDGAGKSAVCA